MQSCRGFPVGVPELRGGAEELNKQACASTQPQPLQTTISLSFSLAWPTNHITASRSAGSRFPLRSVGTLRSSCYPTISSGWLMGLSALPFLLAFFLFSPPMLQRDVVHSLGCPYPVPIFVHTTCFGFRKSSHIPWSPLSEPSLNNLYSFLGVGGRRPWMFLCMRLLYHFQALLFFSRSLSLAHIYILESIFSTCDQQVNHHFHHIYLGVNFN